MGCQKMKKIADEPTILSRVTVKDLASTRLNADIAVLCVKAPHLMETNGTLNNFTISNFKFKDKSSVDIMR